MPEMFWHRNLGGVDLLRRSCFYYASVAGAQAANAFGFGINGNTASSFTRLAQPQS
jgi:hypothetical protein